MTQKILAGRADGASVGADLVRVKVDQVVVARDPHRLVAEALAIGARRCAVETAVLYETRCVTSSDALPQQRQVEATSREFLNLGGLVCRPGVGFPGPVHLERFASPARLAVTDDPRLCAVGGAGLLALVLAPHQLAEALAGGSVWLRTPRSVQVLLSGRVRPFVCVRDVTLELLRRGLRELVERVDREHGAPVVLEFAGPSARLLSVGERAVLAGLAPQVGAAGALFLSDEKTEVFLRDQRRSKAHRTLAPDPGAPCDAVISVDLAAVDPLLLDEQGVVRQVRELAGKPVSQVLLGGDSGVSLRDLLAAAGLLKSKRVPPRLELLLAPPSRQTLEVLAQSGALLDLVATGVRLLEPDRRVVTGELYPPAPGGVSLRCMDPEPSVGLDRFVVGSAETLAHAVATGVVGDPRSFKRPVRVTVPRALPTDDTLVVKKGKGKAKGEGEGARAAPPAAPHPRPWLEAEHLAVQPRAAVPAAPSALVLKSLDEVRWVLRHLSAVAEHARAVVAPHLPGEAVTLLSAYGVLALAASEAELTLIAAAATLEVRPPPAGDGQGRLPVRAGEASLELEWRARGLQRDWVRAGGARARPPSGKDRS